jgi:hypothetical protein
LVVIIGMFASPFVEFQIQALGLGVRSEMRNKGPRGSISDDVDLQFEIAPADGARVAKREQRGFRTSLLIVTLRLATAWPP